MSESDDDTPTLSMGTFLALQEFYAEQEKQDLQLQEILHTGKDHNNFEEDWVNRNIFAAQIEKFTCCIYISVYGIMNAKLAYVSSN